MVVWDLSHAAGVLAIDLHAAGAQLAVGCTYKFLNGGPGSPAFTYVAAELQAQMTQPIWGWFSQQDQFAMGPTYTPRTDIGRMLIGTPSILALTGAEVGIGLSAAAGIDAIAAKARPADRPGHRAVRSTRARRRARRATTHRRGGHVSVVHPDCSRR